MNYDEKCQLMIIGDSMVGKTSLLYRYQQDKFLNNYNASVGIDFFTKEETIDGKKVRIKLWDTAGQERFKSITKAFTRNADGLILAFDVTNRDSFMNLKFWVTSVNRNNNDDKEFKKIIIGNKIDLESEVQKREAEAFAKENDCAYFETSAKEGKGFDEAVRYIVTKIIGNKNENENVNPNKPAFRVSKLDPNNTYGEEKEKKCFC